MSTAKMIQRFEGNAGRAALEEVLQDQKLVHGDTQLAKRLAEVGSLRELEKGEALITQDAEDTDVFFIITGKFQIKVHDREVATRGTGEHVGEMAALVVTAKRSATVMATEPAIVLKVSADDFKAAANEYPKVWQYVVRQLVDRLTQRNDLVRPASQKPRVFIISSTEALPIAREIESHLQYDDCLGSVRNPEKLNRRPSEAEIL